MSTKYKHDDAVPSDVLCARLDELAEAITKDRETFLREFTMRVPAEMDRDADLVISAVAKRIRELESELESEFVPRSIQPNSTRRVILDVTRTRTATFTPYPGEELTVLYGESAEEDVALANLGAGSYSDGLAEMEAEEEDSFPMPSFIDVDEDGTLTMEWAYHNLRALVMVGKEPRLSGWCMIEKGGPVPQLLDLDNFDGNELREFLKKGQRYREQE